MNLIDEGRGGERRPQGGMPAGSHFHLQVGGHQPETPAQTGLWVWCNIYNRFQPTIIAAEKYNKGDVAIGIQPTSGESPGGGGPADRHGKRHPTLYHQL